MSRIAKRSLTRTQAELVDMFLRCGYVRVRDPKRALAGDSAYKRGYEVRFSLGSSPEVVRMLGLLAAAGFKPGTAFRKGNKFVLPVYGREGQAWFVAQAVAVNGGRKLGFDGDGRRLVRRAHVRR